ncbi:hypothetical protein PR202_ga27788 [Eleusine coracana subsp. coracana]|uniref:Uncharacterized protein n=1 Tax=Eleusine coracana subsp. coracana TaxID=191504 RepID=A0AAV5DH24_ELECO|nr:hypothetical protein PR202_ga27788 [Eleusine coracana subsp. coracana]
MRAFSARDACLLAPASAVTAGGLRVGLRRRRRRLSHACLGDGNVFKIAWTKKELAWRLELAPFPRCDGQRRSDIHGRRMVAAGGTIGGHGLLILSATSAATAGLSTAGGAKGKSSWKLKSVVTLALTLLTSSQAILIVWSKRAGKYEYSVTTANFSVEALKCLLSLAALFKTRNRHGVTEVLIIDAQTLLVVVYNVLLQLTRDVQVSFDFIIFRLTTSFDEVSVYPIPAVLYMVKDLLQLSHFAAVCQYYIFAYVDAPAYQILKNLNIISTGDGSLSGFAGVCTEAIIKKRPSRNINVQNWLYIFGVIFNLVVICVQDYDAVMNKGFFYGYSFITVLMILNYALSGIAVSMVMKYADNIVKVYSTSVAMLLTAVVSVFLFNFHLSFAFFLGPTVVSVSVYLHSAGKLQPQK